jgi:hypothetical protein
VLVEPAPEPASIAQGIGIPVIRDYFSLEAVNQSGLVRKPPRIISLNFVFANMPSPKDVLRQIVQLSDPSTIISIMTGYHPAQLQVGMFDYVYHEHLSYFSCWDFQKMAKEFGLTITYAREVPLKGGSLHIEMQLFKDSTDESEVFKTMLKREAWIDSPIGNQWASVSHKISSAQETVRAEITKARLDSMAVIGYGASHSTTTLSHALAISSDFDVIIDDGNARSRVHLDRAYNGLYIPKLIWRELENFSSGGICLVLSSAPYDENDYIRNYNEFLDYKNTL